eukprot:COSAG04_NODE_6_length_47123_cov_87.347482_3_plen_223_part_00
MGWGSTRRLRHHAAAVGAARATAEPRAAPRWRAAPGAEAEVRVAAVQISGYDKGELPRPRYDPVAPLLPHIARAGADGAALCVFPEYVLGHIAVPGDSTRRIGAAAREAGAYVIVGCWEVVSEERLRNTALLFDRRGEIVGKYHKSHAAVDSWDEGTEPWTNPPAGRGRDWLLSNDPEWCVPHPLCPLLRSAQSTLPAGAGRWSGARACRCSSSTTASASAS